MAVQAIPVDAQVSQTNAMRTSFIDVGKGDCILLQTGGAAALIDAGYEETADEVIAYVRACGVERLEFIVITHYDRDHVGGVGPVGRDLSVGSIYLPGYEGSDKNYRMLMEAIEDLGVPARQVTEPLPLKLGNVVLNAFPSKVGYVPASGKREGNDNDLSLVASLINGNDSYLFTGDLEEEGIAAYLDGRQGRFDVLKIPHHGQKSSLTDELLEAVRPQIAVITDCADDPADKKVLKLLKEIGAEAYRTGDSGTIVVESDGAGAYSVSSDKS